MNDIRKLLDELSVKELKELIRNEIMTSKEVQQELNITQQRLSSMKKRKLTPIKKGIYLKREVEMRKVQQSKLRDKYLHTEEYKK